MSTYLYMTCLDHTPPLVASDESGQHLYDLPRIRTEIANRVAIVDDYDSSRIGRYQGTGYLEENSAAFLSQHRTCNIGITNEYGESYATTDQ